MCGIVSIISSNPSGFFQKDLEIFENLLVLDTLRGLDSTGVFSVDTARNVNIMKVASHPYHLFACEGWKKWRGKAVSNGRILVGHNRKATQGSINSKNAHPFHENNIVLVHNGTLRQDHKKLADVDVDSHAICHAINEKGVENVIPHLQGAFALVWWDIEKNSLFAVRNDERPLSIVKTDTAYYMLSEPWMALQLLAREGKKVVETFDIKPGQLYEFKIGGNYTVTQIDLKEPDWTNYTKQYGQGNCHVGRVRQSGVQTPSVEGPKPTQTSGSTSATSVQTGNPVTTTGGTTSHSNLTLVKSGERPPGMPDEHTGHVDCEEFPRGSEVQVKLYEMKPSGDGKWYTMRGKVSEPGKPELDVIGFERAAVINEGGKVVAMTNGQCVATVIKHTESLCGRSLYVRNVSPAGASVHVHNANITEREWNYVLHEGKCKQCGSKITEYDQLYTSVSRKPNNKLSITCPDCIEDKLIGEYKHEFTQNRLATLQAWEFERHTSDGTIKSSPATAAASSPTLH